ncbi:MAG: hypothetical protein ACMXYE_05145 [Candidatus Woesearchaeota archaeon]
MTKEFTLAGILRNSRPEIMHKLYETITHNFGKYAIITGIKDDSRDDISHHTYTYGIPLNKIKSFELSHDILDYARDTIVVYDAFALEETENGDFKVDNPEKAVKGFIKLTW